MNKIIRLNFIKYQEIFDISVSLDLSLKENIEGIIKLLKYQYQYFEVYDPGKKIFINTDILVKCLNIPFVYELEIY